MGELKKERKYRRKLSRKKQQLTRLSIKKREMKRQEKVMKNHQIVVKKTLQTTQKKKQKKIVKRTKINSFYLFCCFSLNYFQKKTELFYVSAKL